MNYFSKSNIITGLVIALFVINLAALLTFVLRPAFLFPQSEFTCRPGCKPGEFLQRELNLSPGQSGHFSKARAAHADSIRAIAALMQQTRSLISREMMQAEPDTNFLFTESDNLGKYYADIRKLNMMHYWQLKSVCDDTQKKKLDSVFGKLFCYNDGISHHCGKHKPKNSCQSTDHKHKHKHKHQHQPRHKN